MAFAFGSQTAAPFGPGAPSAAGNAHASTGPPLQEIATENLGFLAFSGDTKVQLFPSPWPAESLPPPTSSLLSVSSLKGLVAAASPDAVIIASTRAVREAFENDAAATDNIKPFTPQVTIPIGTRISQVAFSADGTHLVISAENGGGLAVYETQALLAGKTQSTFELGTDQVSLRALVPNPAPESAHLFAVVTTNGDLMMADMKARTFLATQNGKILKSGVSCVSWSNKGKQLVAGLGNGSATQLTPEGVAKAEIPRAPDLEAEQHVSSAYWLENDLFIMTYTPSATDELPPASSYRLITRQPKTQNYAFQVLPEVCSPFGVNRQPSFQFMQRLRGFPPHIKDLILVSSTSSEDVGIFTRADEPLSSDSPNTKDVFTMTSLSDDSRRAAVPMANMTDPTSAIGMAMDLSSTSKVARPIPSDDIEFSPGPLPAVLILNHLGVLSGWWVVYSDSIRQDKSYPGLVANAENQPAQAQTQSNGPPFGSNSSQNPHSAFGSAPSLGANSQPAFGSTSFGSTPSLGSRPSPWGGNASSAAPSSSGPTFGQTSFGQPAFGSATPIGAANPNPAFGSTSGLGSKPSLWGSSTQSTSQSATGGSVFGQSSGLGNQQSSVFGSQAPSAGTSSGLFGSGPSSSSTGGGFASFATGSGFGSLATGAGPTGAKTSESIFSQKSTGSFGSTKKTDSVFGASDQASTASGGIFGSGTGFKLGTSWTNPDTNKETASATSQGGSSLFGSGFASALSQPNVEEVTSKEADMMTDEGQSSAIEPDNKAPTAPTFKASSGLFSAPPPATGSIFGSKTAAEATQSSSTSKLFSPEPQATPLAKTSTLSSTVALPLASQTPSKDIAKSEKAGNIFQTNKSQEPPLPPDPTSKSSYTPGNSSSSAASQAKNVPEEPPLPPNPFANPTKAKSDPHAEEAPLPPDFTKTVSEASPEPTTKKEDVPLPPDLAAKAENAPLPPDYTKPATVKAEKSEAENAPLPPDFTKSSDLKAERSEASETVSSLPEVVRLGDESLPSSDDSGIDEEGSGVDIAKELHANDEHSPDISPVSSFGTKTDRASVAGSLQIAASARENPKTLFGEISDSSIPNLGPPRKDPQSPRSPSPVRATRNVLRAEASRSVSAPGVPLRADSTRKVTLGRPAVTRGVYPPNNAERSQNDERERLAKKQAEAKAAEEGELTDGDVREVKEYLTGRLEPVLTLDPLFTHNDYLGQPSKPGIPGQVERVYRDINSMVDTLGMNARALERFVEGHQTLYAAGGRSRDDLDDGHDWTLDEIEVLMDIEDSIEQDQASEKIENPAAIRKACEDLFRDLSRLKIRQTDLKNTFNAVVDAEKREALRTGPLSIEQSSQRNDLRTKHTELLQILLQAEEAVSLLKAKTASIRASTDARSGGSSIPTVEAVERTINKMTSMFEKRSGDIDVLEAQMRTLRMTSAEPTAHERAPFETPPRSAIRAEASPASSLNGRSSFYTAGSRRSVFGGSTSAVDTPSRTPGRMKRSPGKKMAEIDEDMAKQYAKKAERKRHVRKMLKEALVSRSIIVRPLED